MANSLRALACLYDVRTYDADGFDLDEADLHDAVAIGIAAARDEARRTIQRLSPLDECPGYLRGELHEAERVLRFADVDLAGLVSAGSDGLSPSFPPLTRSTSTFVSLGSGQGGAVVMDRFLLFFRDDDHEWFSGSFHETAIEAQADAVRTARTQPPGFMTSYRIERVAMLGDKNGWQPIECTGKRGEDNEPAEQPVAARDELTENYAAALKRLEDQ